MEASIRTGERTRLAPADEVAFQQWVRAAGITDADSPQSRYDYRGYWRDVASRGQDQTKAYADGPHFPDTYKQHGHPTFSVESNYSAGPHDGGRWLGEAFVPPGADFLMNARGQMRQRTNLLRDALLAQLSGAQ